MIGWQPRDYVNDRWHLSLWDGAYPAVSLCGTRVQGVDMYVKRDPAKIDLYRGARCAKCWQEWRLLVAAEEARQDQDEAARK
jgi:hypothetical protein